MNVCGLAKQTNVCTDICAPSLKKKKNPKKQHNLFIRLGVKRRTNTDSCSILVFQNVN